MRRLGTLVSMASLSSPALAAGGWDDMPTPFFIAMLLWMTLLCGMPCVGLGFFLQGLMRLRNALILLAFGFLFLTSFGAAAWGLARTLELAPVFAAAFLFFAPLFGAGWFAGIWAANRQMKHRQPA
jgi:hypothetical protein